MLRSRHSVRRNSIEPEFILNTIRTISLQDSSLQTWRNLKGSKLKSKRELSTRLNSMPPPSFQNAQLAQYMRTQPPASVNLESGFVSRSPSIIIHPRPQSGYTRHHSKHRRDSTNTRKALMILQSKCWYTINNETKSINLGSFPCPLQCFFNDLTIRLIIQQNQVSPCHIEAWQMIHCIFSIVNIFINHKCSSLGIGFISSSDLINSPEFPEDVVEFFSWYLVGQVSHKYNSVHLGRETTVGFASYIHHFNFINQRPEIDLFEISFNAASTGYAPGPGTALCIWMARSVYDGIFN